MSGGDFILIQSIRQLNDQFSSDRLDEDDSELGQVASVGDFSPDLVLESVARCLNAILASQDQVPFASVKPPQSVSARYHMSSQLADYCKQLGYPAAADLGYQTFLYGSEKDIRNIFQFLIGKLPRALPLSSSAEAQDVKSVIKRQFWANVRAELSDFWSPSCVFPSGLKPLPGGGFSRRGIRGCGPFLSCSMDFAANERHGSGAEILQTASRLVSSLISYNENLLCVPNYVSSRGASKGSDDARRRQEERLEPARFDGTQDSGDIVGTIEINRSDIHRLESAPEAKEEAQVDIDMLMAQKEALTVEVLQLQAEHMALHDEVLKLQKEMAAQGEQSLAKQQVNVALLTKEAERREQLLLMLPEAEAHVLRLQTLVSKTKDKLKSLRAQWQERKAATELIREQLMEQVSTQEVRALSTKGELVRLLEAVHHTERELKAKDLLERRLRSEVSKLPKSAPRSVYTQQILDTMNNVSKQRHQTDRIIADVKTTQKDINSLHGKLERTYMEADRYVFEMARKDPELVDAYKSLTELHHESDNTVALIRQAGIVKRAIRASRDQVDAEVGKKLADKMQKMGRDLDQIKGENQALKAKLKGRPQ